MKIDELCLDLDISRNSNRALRRRKKLKSNVNQKKKKLFLKNLKKHDPKVNSVIAGSNPLLLKLQTVDSPDGGDSDQWNVSDTGWVSALNVTHSTRHRCC
jgi:hypothetical protein